MKLRGLISIAAGMLFTSQVAADDLGVLLACVEIENDIARLECFDEAAASMREREEPAGESVDSQQTSDSAVRPPTDPSKVKEADEKMVEGCEFLGTVVGKSGWGGLAARKGGKGAMRSAKKQAAKLGATHIVVGAFDVGKGMEMSTSRGRAYYCDDGS